MITVAIVDDQPDMRAALREQLVGLGFDVVGEAADGNGAVSLARAAAPDVILMDVRMPGRDGISATATINDERLTSRVLVLTTFDDDAVVAEALGAGAAGFWLKNSGPESLASAIRHVAAGEAVLDAAVAPRVFACFAQNRSRGESAGLALLTPRERDVLELLCRGLTNAEIGAALFVGEATAKTHVSRVIAKLEVRDRVQAVVHAFEHGFGAHLPRD